jgi:hypothetical protein
MAELCTVGTLSGAAMSLGQRAGAAVRRRSDPDWQPAVRAPDLRAGATGLAVSMGVFANARYQIISGVDRYVMTSGSFT